ncbi:caspase family protein [Nitrospira japonica]|uniref:caspase family protein n=1 Tax=Nitrospira japonica TaxID=1325564 RepID=UPI0009BB3051|nr:hypothetical protein [Nitrospira japonica]
MRQPQRDPWAFLPRVTGQALAWLSLFLLTSCGLFASRDGLGTGYYLPLTVHVRMAPIIGEAQLTYQDVCGTAKVLPIGTMLTTAIKRKSGLVFEKVMLEEKAGVVVDGYEDVSLGLLNADVNAYRKANKSYPATVEIGLDFAFTTADGTVLYNKKLKSMAKGEVETTDTSCDVTGLDSVAQAAVDKVTDGMAKQLGTSAKIATFSEARASGTAAASSSTASAPPSPLAAAAVQAAPAVAAQSSTPSSPPPAPPQTTPSTPKAAPAVPDVEPATITFRAIILDENRNQLLHTGEVFSVEIEIKNEGPADASGLEIQVSGTPELIDQIPDVLSVGDLAAGGAKRLSVEGKIGTVKEETQAELVLTMRSRSPLDRLPSSKKFVVAMKPDTVPEATASPVDVDQLPKQALKVKQPKAVGIAIGVGQFRESGVQRVRHAAHDAEVVAAYWQGVVGISADRVRRLTDSHALKGDLTEVFEDWLLKQADSGTVAYVYLSGRGTVDASTGAVSIVPFDGTPSSSARLYSLRRLNEALARSPVQFAIVILDLSLESTAVKDGVSPVSPVWEQTGQGTEKIMWMVGNRSVQEAHPYDLGQHGLFTYEILNGLGGPADFNQDGIVLAGELCTYAKGRVFKAARERFGNEQEPLCIPLPGKGAEVRLQPVSRLK